MKTLYVSDMDGTLLGNDSRISFECAEMLNALTDCGVMHTVATARTPATVQPLLSDVKQSFYINPEDGSRRPLPAIVMTGAGLWNRDAVAFESLQLIDKDEAECIRDTMRASGVHPFVYCVSPTGFINVYHPAELSRRENSFYQERRHLQLKRFHLGQDPAWWDRVALFFAIGPIDKVKTAATELQKVVSCATAWYPDIILPETGLIDLHARGVSKAKAVQDLKRQTGAERLVVFGDNLNDLPMMRVADVAVAVENALPAVKDEANVVIGSNASNAVPRFIAQDSGITL